MADLTRERLPAPKAEIRRFDVFAEYNRLKAEHSGMPPDEAKGQWKWRSSANSSM